MSHPSAFHHVATDHHPATRYRGGDAPFADHRVARARNRLHAEPVLARIIEVGEIAAGIAVPEPGGVRFHASARDFDSLDGTVFRSTEQAAKAARDRFRALTRPGQRAGGRGLRAV